MLRHRNDGPEELAIMTEDLSEGDGPEDSIMTMEESAEEVEETTYPS